MLFQGQFEKLPVRLFAAVIRGQIDGVKQRFDPQHPQLTGGENPLGVGQQVHLLPVGPKDLQQLHCAVIQSDIVDGSFPEPLAGPDGQRKIGADPLVQEQLEKDLLQLDLRVSFVGILAQNPGALFPLGDGLKIGLVQLLRLVVRSETPIPVRHFLPEFRPGFVGVDVHQGAVQVKDAVRIAHTQSFFR